MFKFTTLLSILKYFGLLLATVSTIWGLTHELATKDDSGNRRLTKAGRYSIALVILGLLISLNTTTLEILLKQRADDRARAEKLEEQSRKQQEQQQQALDRLERRDEDRKRAEEAQQIKTNQAESTRTLQETTFQAEQRASIQATLREQRQSRMALQQHTGVIHELSRLLQPLNEMKLDPVILFPRYQPLVPYLDRIERVSSRYLASLDANGHSTANLGIYSQGQTVNGRYVPEAIRIPRESGLFPDRQTDCDASMVVEAANINIFLFKNPLDVAKLPSLQDMTEKADLQLRATGFTRLLEYDPRSKRLAAVLELATNNTEAWDSTTNIASVADLPGSQMFLLVSIGGGCVGSNFPPYLDLGFFEMRIAKRKFEISMKNLKPVHDSQGVRYYVLTFPSGQEEFRKFIESGTDTVWYTP
ncbi:MAG: hypothetical protein QOG23_1124 [Blastocatellia bacterium]|jgi:hypothetical protein|nr:hypothetical protein [Blastocatellia bacterium]